MHSYHLMNRFAMQIMHIASSQFNDNSILFDCVVMSIGVLRACVVHYCSFLSACLVMSASALSSPVDE